MTSPREVLYEARGIRKSFGHVHALRGASLAIERGEIVALVGDNGAGKSTFVGVLSGVHSPDSGTLTMDGEERSIGSVRAAADLGITTVHQDLALCPDLSPTENAFLGRELRRSGIAGLLGFQRDKEMAEQTTRVLESLGIFLQSTEVPVSSLSGGQRQVVAVARAAMWADKLIILDEPTAALGARQSRIVNETILRARERGLTILLVSHDLPSVIEIADRIAIMRQGQVATVIPAKTATVPQIVALMLGQDDAPAHEGASESKGDL